MPGSSAAQHSSWQAHPGGSGDAQVPARAPIDRVPGSILRQVGEASGAARAVPPSPRALGLAQVGEFTEARLSSARGIIA